jgi:hypothetical protein
MLCLVMKQIATASTTMLCHNNSILVAVSDSNLLYMTLRITAKIKQRTRKIKK